MSIGGVLFLILAALKLTDVIDWSWWWVTMPLWWWPMTLFWRGVSGWLGSLFSRD